VSAHTGHDPSRIRRPPSGPFSRTPFGSLTRSRAGIPIFRASLVQTGDTPPARPALEKFLPAENAALRLVGKEVQPAL
ncbi:MAG: hypothetical protein ACK4NR_12290, partial [Micavibrio sp.]